MRSVRRHADEIKHHRLPIDPIWEAAIANGSKSVEARLARGAVLRIRVGDILVLGNTRTKIRDIESYPSFAAMLNGVGIENALPGVETLEHGVDIYHGFRGYGTNELDCGIRALHLHVV